MEEKCMKNGEITISGQISKTCTGTPLNLEPLFLLFLRI